MQEKSQLSSLIDSESIDSVNLGLFMLMNSPEAENWRSFLLNKVGYHTYLIKFNDFVEVPVSNRYDTMKRMFCVLVVHTIWSDKIAEILHLDKVMGGTAYIDCSRSELSPEYDGYFKIFNPYQQRKIIYDLKVIKNVKEIILLS